jgi:hypothetical protein
MGPVRSKSNFRRGRAGAGRQWQQLHDFEAATALALRQARPDDWDCAGHDLPVAQRPVVVVAVVARTLLDAGNLSKSLLDAAQGVLYPTDASVGGVAEITERGRDRQRSLVGFAQLPAGTERTEVTQALSALSRLVVETYEAGHPG